MKYRNGGPLGIISLQEIEITTNSIVKHKKTFSKLPGVISIDGNVFGFESGPSIRLEIASNPSIKKIVIKVKSLAVSKSYLNTQNLLGPAKSQIIFILEAAIDGLRVELTE